MQTFTVTLTSNDLMSVTKVAKELGISRMTVYRWVKGLKIIGVDLGGYLLIPRSEVERLKGRIDGEKGI